MDWKQAIQTFIQANFNVLKLLKSSFRRYIWDSKYVNSIPCS